MRRPLHLEHWKTLSLTLGSHESGSSRADCSIHTLSILTIDRFSTLFSVIVICVCCLEPCSKSDQQSLLARVNFFMWRILWWSVFWVHTGSHQFQFPLPFFTLCPACVNFSTSSSALLDHATRAASCFLGFRPNLLPTRSPCRPPPARPPPPRAHIHRHAVATISELPTHHYEDLANSS